VPQCPRAAVDPREVLVAQTALVALDTTMAIDGEKGVIAISSAARAAETAKLPDAPEPVSLAEFFADRN
jgi:hypothetical protein